MKRTDTLLWHVHAANGDLLAACRYAYAATTLALSEGAGAKITHLGAVVLDVAQRDTTWEAADAAAKRMIALAYPPAFARGGQALEQLRHQAHMRPVSSRSV